jgi:uroporphyrinogen decarboxylase
MPSLTSKQRMLTALTRGVPDRLPVTSHHLMRYFLDRYLDGVSDLEFFDRFGMDAYTWLVPICGEPGKSWVDECGMMQGENWRIEREAVHEGVFPGTRFTIHTPKGRLTAEIQENVYTEWVTERPVKQKSDIDLLAEYLPAPVCDRVAVNARAVEFGERGLVRGNIPCFDLYGQPGCWQDAACLVGIEKLILETYDDPGWVHELLGILQRRKLAYIRTLEGAAYDLLELGGGDASSTVISPRLFDQFVAPYDSVLIQAAHEVGQRIVYHTCGGMMPLLERIAAMGPDAMETFTPAGMGGDVDLRQAKRRIGAKVCMIGGFDQFHFFIDNTAEKTRAEVRRCFEEAGGEGGFILSPSDHFFDADPALIAAFADEARRCIYSN